MHFSIEVHPYPDETLTSWIIRNAIANGSDPRSFAISVFKKNSTWYEDIDRYLPSERAMQLSLFCSLTPHEIQEMTLEPTIQKLSHKSSKNNPYAKWQLITPMGAKGAIRTNGFYFCPECLAQQEVYLRKEWKMAWVIACPKHKKLLTLTCEQCGQIFSPYKVTYELPDICLCTNCGFDLRTSKSGNVNEEALSFQNKLSQIAFNDDFKGIKFPLLKNDAKDLFLTLTFFFSLFVRINKKEKYTPIFHLLNLENNYTFVSFNNTTFARMHIKDREYLLCAISILFAMSLEEIITLFQDISMSQYRFKRTFRAISPTIQHVLGYLDSTVIYKPSRKLSREISPKSKEEVDKLFEEIREYIQI